LAQACNLPDRFPAGTTGTCCNKLQQISEKARNAPQLRPFSPKIAIPFELSSRPYPAYSAFRERAGACGDRQVVLFF
jgi:hypothetical protein